MQSINNPEYNPNENPLVAALQELYGVNPEYNLDYFEKLYPERDLPEGAMVTRMAPSPTGFMHIGSIYMAEACERLAHSTGGRFYLRIEDTDQDRKIEGAEADIINSLESFGISTDEDPLKGGDYGPYIQSDRTPVYYAAALKMIADRNAYICFASEEEIAHIREVQSLQKTDIGVYGEWSKWRDASIEQTLEELAKGTPFVVRYKNMVKPKDKVQFKDVLKGDITMGDNFNDTVILKANGLPTYHFAHVVDDHFMRTTHVIRGDEWLSSTPNHLQLFAAMGWEPPVYGHAAPIEKEEDGKRRKLSKRKDPEARAGYYLEAGYPIVGVRSYILNLLDSSFEEWRRDNPTEDIKYYRFSPKALAKSGGALFDLKKLEDISKDEIANMTAEEVYTHALEWATTYNPEFGDLLAQDREYAISVFNIERKTEKPRKDIAKWSDIPEKLGFFFYGNRKTEIKWEEYIKLTPEVIETVRNEIGINYKEDLTRDEWQAYFRDIAARYNFSLDRKEYKASPEKYAGFWGDVATIVRVSLAGENKSPDLYETMKVMGQNRIQNYLVSESKR